jgi:mRNA interferase MazF
MKNAKRGEVWLVDLGYAAKTRPCLVISSELQADDRALVAAVAHTTSPCGSRFEIKTDERFLKE